MNVPDDLKQKCPLCAGEGNREQRNFCSAGEMDAGVEPQTHAVGCYLCKGSGFTWTLDQQEMAERIAELRAENAELVRKHNEQFKAAAQLAEVVVKLNAENARLSAPVTDVEWACANYQQGFSTGIVSTKEGEPTVMNWQQFTTRELINALIAARKGAAS